jgi:hypothetical protein
MAVAENIREKLNREPFEPFRVRTTGDSYNVRDPKLVIVLKREVFIAEPNSDRHVFIPFVHIAAVERLPAGRNGKSTRRKRKPS